jgi:hypothetical protein
MSPLTLSLLVEEVEEVAEVAEVAEAIFHLPSKYCGIF